MPFDAREYASRLSERFGGVDEGTFNSFVDELERQRSEWIRRHGKTPTWRIDLTPFQFNLQALRTPHFDEFQKATDRKFFTTREDMEEAKQAWKPGMPKPTWMNKHVEAQFIDRVKRGGFAPPTEEEIADAKRSGVTKVVNEAIGGFMGGAAGVARKVAGAADLVGGILNPGQMLLGRRPVSEQVNKLTKATEGEAAALSRKGMDEGIGKAMVSSLSSLAAEAPLFSVLGGKGIPLAKGLRFRFPLGKMLMPGLAASEEYAREGTVGRGLISGSFDQAILDAAKYLPGGTSKPFTGWLRKFAAGAGFAGKAAAESALSGDKQWYAVDRTLPAFTLAFVMEKSKERDVPTATLLRTKKNLEQKLWALANGKIVSKQAEVAKAAAEGKLYRPENAHLKRFFDVMMAHDINEKAYSMFVEQLEAANGNFQRAKVAAKAEAEKAAAAVRRPMAAEGKTLDQEAAEVAAGMNKFEAGRRRKPNGEGILAMKRGEAPRFNAAEEMARIEGIRQREISAAQKAKAKDQQIADEYIKRRMAADRRKLTIEERAAAQVKPEIPAEPAKVEEAIDEVVKVVKAIKSSRKPKQDLEQKVKEKSQTAIAEKKSQESKDEVLESLLRRDLGVPAPPATAAPKVAKAGQPRGKAEPFGADLLLQRWPPETSEMQDALRRTGELRKEYEILMRRSKKATGRVKKNIEVKAEKLRQQMREMTDQWYGLFNRRYRPAAGEQAETRRQYEEARAREEAAAEGLQYEVVKGTPGTKPYPNEEAFNNAADWAINFAKTQRRDAEGRSSERDYWDGQRKLLQNYKRVKDHEGIRIFEQEHRGKSVGNVRTPIESEAWKETGNDRKIREVVRRINRAIDEDEAAGVGLLRPGKPYRNMLNQILTEAMSPMNQRQQENFLERYYAAAMAEGALIPEVKNPEFAPREEPRFTAGGKSALHAVNAENRMRERQGLPKMTPLEQLRFEREFVKADTSEPLVAREFEKEPPPSREDYGTPREYRDAVEKWRLAQRGKTMEIIGAETRSQKGLRGRQFKNIEEQAAEPIEFNAGVNPTAAIRELGRVIRGSRLGQEAGAMTEEVQSAMFPTFSPKGKEMAGLYIAEMGKSALRGEQLARRYLGYKNVMEKMNPEVRDRIIDDYENGRSINAADAAIYAQTANSMAGKKVLGAGDVRSFFKDMKGTFDDLYATMRQLNVDVDYWNNYFPHLYKFPGRVRAAIGYSGWRGQGNQGFKQHRGAGMETIAKARAAYKAATGQELEMKFSNPIDSVLYQMAQMQKLITSKTVIMQAKKLGLVYARTGKMPMPGEGWIRLNGDAGKVMAKSKGIMKQVGEWYAVKGAADVINNYNSAGLEEGQFGSIYSNVRRVANFINNIQLNASAFHAGFTTMDVMFGHFGIGMRKAATRGMRGEGIKDMLTAFLPTTVVRNFRGGTRFQRALLEGDVNYAKEIATWAESGQRLRMTNEYTNHAVRGFKEALSQHRYLRAIGRAPFAAIEAVSWPIMEKLVPAQKIGLMLDEIKFINRKAELESWSPEETRAEIQRAAKSIDDRMGQIVYDNRFWNKAVKSAAFLTVRSVGWNVGTLDVFGGAAKNIFRMASRPGGKAPRIDPALGYAAGLVFGTALYGALYQAVSTLIVTGKADIPDATPEGAFDLFFPKTGRLLADGNPERVSFPTYVKDLFAFYNHPGRTLSHKMHPSIGILRDIITNEDFWQYEIHDPRNDSSIFERLLAKSRLHPDYLKYVAGQLVPYSLQNIRTRLERGASPVESLGSMVGIVPAAKAMTSTPFENEVYDLYNEIYGSRLKPYAQRALDEVRQKIRNAIREKRYSDANMIAAKAMSSGMMTEKQFENIIKSTGSGEKPAVRMFRMLSPDLKKVLFEKYKSSFSPEEQQRYWPYGE